MELEYANKNSRRSKVYIAVGVIISLLVAATVYLALQASGITQDKAVEMRDVVVAAGDVAARTPLEEGDLAMRTVAVDPTNETALTRIDEALGRVSSVPITAGQLVTTNMLASTTTGQAFSIIEPGQEFDPEGEDLRAVSITVPDERAVAGTLQAGQRVDLVVTMAINPALGETGEQTSSVPSEEESAAEEEEAPAESAAPGLIAGPTTKATLQNLTLLSRTGAIYILRANLATTEKIAELMAAGGQFTLVLRPDEDDRTADTEGSTIDRLLEEFGFPVPQMPDLEQLRAER